MIPPTSGIASRLKRALAGCRERERGELLVRRGILDPARLEEALAELEAPGAPADLTLERICIERGWVALERIVAAEHDFAAVEFERATRMAAPEVPPEAAAVRGLPGRTVGDYLLVQPLGGGGLGEVWKAWDSRLGRWVALKRPHSVPSSREAWERFRREAVAAGRLAHPHLVPVYDAGTSDGRPYLVMPCLEGRTLDAAGLPLREAIEAVRSAALALHHAHERGVVHRDVKPSNILIDGAGKPWVLDFGIAHLAGSGNLTSAGTVLGTAAFMAPEQGRGEASSREPAVDVYGLGATLYWLAAGRPPYEGDSFAEILRKVGEAEPAAPRRINPGIPRDLDAIVLKAMARDPRRRYASAAELAADLDRYSKGEPVLAKPPSRWTRIARSLRRPAIFAPAALLLAVAIALAAILWKRSPGPDSSALNRLEAARNELDRAHAALYDAAVPPAELHARLGAARRTAEEVLASNPGLPLALHRLAETWEIEGYFDRAESTWRRVVEVDPAFAPARFRLGHILLLRAYLVSLNLWDEPEEAALSASRKLAQEGVLHLERAEAEGSGYDSDLQRRVADVMRAYLRGDRAAVLSMSREGIASFSGQRGVEEFHWLAALVRDSKQEAIEDFGLALAVRPKFALALYGRAMVRYGMQEYERAQSDFDEAIRVSPGFAEAWLYRGTVRIHLKDAAGAIADFGVLIARDALAAGAYNGRGYVKLDQLGDLDGAIADLTEAHRRKPDTYRLPLAFRAEAYLKKRDWEAALRDAAQGYRISRWSYCLRLLADAARGRHDPEAGLRLMDQLGVPADDPNRRGLEAMRRDLPR